MNARQARDWQDVKSQFLDDFADAVADSSHISAQSDRAMSHFLATITYPLAHDVKARLFQVDRYLAMPATTPPISRVVAIGFQKNHPSRPAPKSVSSPARGRRR
ncbi:BQ5605_C026g10150 [Microbotryum silenes-dioicae]|uniref:BQ5605_C026g10150 protein n=1 Tax=Microbotryum silenes-dioicae TaxID=796604 RepID=A0A2X0MMQ0_9BASI|nr:BQ5605_C026g10150 [Microbotryum silenes-dioicae]